MISPTIKCKKQKQDHRYRERIACCQWWEVEEMSELFLICLFVSLNHLKKSTKLSFTPEFFGGKNMREQYQK